MGRHQVGHKKLLLSQLFVDLIIFSHEMFINFLFGLAKLIQYGVRNVLRRHFELTADMMLHQLPEKGIVGIGQQIIEPNA